MYDLSGWIVWQHRALVVGEVRSSDRQTSWPTFETASALRNEFREALKWVVAWACSESKLSAARRVFHLDRRTENNGLGPTLAEPTWAKTNSARETAPPTVERQNELATVVPSQFAEKKQCRY
uniref:Uncharacterized protein n=1 Tax=Trichuris muris TaxID=70415 RepID=A0A5S6QAN5_TRIMR